MAPLAVDAKGAAFGLRGGSACGQFFLGQIAAIGMAFAEQLPGNFGVPSRAGKLHDCCFMDGRNGRFGRAGTISIFDAQQVFAAVMASKQPVEQCGARAADVEIARG
jgi:hypothetical protein